MNLVRGWPERSVRLRHEWSQVGWCVWRSGSERRDVWWKGNGAKAVGDWIVANMVEGVLEGTVRTASPCSVEKVDAHKDTFAS